MRRIKKDDRCTELLRRLPSDELRRRSHEIYRNLNDWLRNKTESEIEERYIGLGIKRAKQGVPYSDLFWAVSATKEITSRNFRTADAEQILESVNDKNALSSTTLAHIKAFMSGVFRYAKRRGVLNSENPVSDVVLPQAKTPTDTHAHSLEEIHQMLKVLPEPAATLVAAAAFTGARKGEVRGFLWENYDGEELYISQSFWRGHAAEPKTRSSKAQIPVISQLAEKLNYIMPSREVRQRT